MTIWLDQLTPTKSVLPQISTRVLFADELVFKKATEIINQNHFYCNFGSKFRVKFDLLGLRLGKLLGNAGKMKKILLLITISQVLSLETNIELYLCSTSHSLLGLFSILTRRNNKFRNLLFFDNWAVFNCLFY